MIEPDPRLNRSTQKSFTISKGTLLSMRRGVTSRYSSRARPLIGGLAAAALAGILLGAGMASPPTTETQALRCQFPDGNGGWENRCDPDPTNPLPEPGPPHPTNPIPYPWEDLR